MSLQTADGQMYVNVVTDIVEGVWAVLATDYATTIERVYPNEIDAYRSTNGSGYYQEVLFIPYGMDVFQARKFAAGSSSQNIATSPGAMSSGPDVSADLGQEK